MSNFPNWFSSTPAEGNFLQFLTPRKDEKDFRALQIGAFTGDASLWLLTNIPDCYLQDVDTWEGSDELAHNSMDFGRVEDIYDERTTRFVVEGRLTKNKMRSDEFFAQDYEGMYDFIYIDGDHTAPVVLEDAIQAHKRLSVGGLLAFDDYEWSDGGEPWTTPKPAIDSFFTVYGHLYTTLKVGWQVWLQRVA